MLSKAQRKAVKFVIRSAADDFPISLSSAASYLKIEYQAAWKLKASGVLVVAEEITATPPGRVQVTCGSVRRYKSQQKQAGVRRLPMVSPAPSSAPPEPDHLHMDLLPQPQIAAGGTPVDQADDTLLTLDAVAALLGCTPGRAEELARTQAVPAQWERRPGYDQPEWLMRTGDVRAYREWRDREVSAGRALSRG